MQAYDLIMLVVLGFATILGAIKGFAWQMASLASIFVSYLVAVNFRFDVAKMIQATPPWNMFLAMLILYVGTSFVIWVVFRLLSGLIDGVRLKEFDRHMGAAFGLAKGGLYCLLITMFAMTLLGPKQQEAICQSRSGYYIATALDNAGGVLPKELHDVVGPYLERLDRQLHQKFPDGATDSTASSLWPSGWSGNAGTPSTPSTSGAAPGTGFFQGLGSGGLGSGAGASTSGQGAGAGSNWNFWPGGSAPSTSPTIPPVAPAPQSYPPLTLPPASGSFGFGFGPSTGSTYAPALPTAPTYPQQAQQPSLNWQR